MNKNLIGVMVVVLLIALSIFVFKGNGDSTGSVIDGDSSDVGEISLSPLNVEYHLVEITSMGFSPEVVEIGQGDFVLWINRDSRRHWPVADDASVFDSKKPLKTDEEWEFQFDKVGEWEYHDSLSPSKIGKVVVD